MPRNLVAENWRLERARYAMVGNRCTDCGAYYFPGKAICIKCSSRELSDYVFNGEGTIVEWTKIHEPATGFEMFTPIYYGIIELQEGVRTSVQFTSITDESKLKPGMKTKMVFRKLFSDGDQGIVTYGFKAAPVFE
ncbi:MAG: Zn-ribbon domain-containing OB-fold protein [Candidatus Heimdallarchaeota archaeon]|nr:Zn-ribbon domain-containing OB-fold protein [Candidatus Heimdallarchaeota archaeon]